jgi:hypothetical protein
MRTDHFTSLPALSGAKDSNRWFAQISALFSTRTRLISSALYRSDGMTMANRILSSSFSCSSSWLCTLHCQGHGLRGQFTVMTTGR